MKVRDHASSRIRRVPCTTTAACIVRWREGADYGSSTVTANAGHPRSTLREAARGWPVSRRSPEGMC